MTTPLFYCLVMTIKGSYSHFKCISPASTMRLLQIIVDLLKIRGQIQIEQSVQVTNPELNEESEEEVVTK